MKRVFLLLSLLACSLGCAKDNTNEQENGSGGSGGGEGENPPSELYSQVDSKALKDATDKSKGDVIPDFSRVGYRWGDKPIPTRSVVKTIEAPAAGADAKALIQNAIDEVAARPQAERGAILLKKGLYNISDKITIAASGIVLRGEGNDDNPATSTVLVATKTLAANESTKYSLIVIGSSQSRVVTTQINIKDNYVPVGQFWVTVNNASDYKVGDNVTLYRPATPNWIADIKMDKISGAGSTQWEAKGYNFHAERVITKIEGDKIWFENPVVMALDKSYGGGGVCKYNYKDNRPSEIGIENLFIKSVYDQTKKSGNDFIDENHTWTAIDFKTSEHCWVRNVAGKHFAYALVSVGSAAKNITVTDCRHSEPVSVVTGSRRYIFSNDGQLSLFIRCNSQGGRHSYVASPRNSGPNVFVYCTETDGRSDCGPHHRWNMATLYDNLKTNKDFNIQDRDDMGSGHGWAGVNNVIWNSTVGGRICVQSPWASGRNFAIGVTGSKYAGYRPDRPNGYWSNQNQIVSPTSLYDAQLELRRKLQPGGVMDVK